MTSLLSLPDEILVVIMTMLGLPDILQLSRVSRRMHSVARGLTPKGHTVLITPELWQSVERLAYWPRLSISLKVDAECLRARQDLSAIAPRVRTLECDREAFEALRAQLEGKSFENIRKGRLTWDRPLDDLPELRNMEILVMRFVVEDIPIQSLAKFAQLTMLYLTGCKFKKIKGSDLKALRRLSLVDSCIGQLSDFTQCQSLELVNTTAHIFQRIKAKSVLLFNLSSKLIENLTADNILFCMSNEVKCDIRFVVTIRAKCVVFAGLGKKDEDFDDASGLSVSSLRDIVATELGFHHVGIGLMLDCSCKRLIAHAAYIDEIEYVRAETASCSRLDMTVGDFTTGVRFEGE